MMSCALSRHLVARTGRPSANPEGSGRGVGTGARGVRTGAMAGGWCAEGRRGRGARRVDGGWIMDYAQYICAEYQNR